MAQQAIVIANHKNKTATLNFLDEENRLVAFDNKGQALTKMNFSYGKISTYEDLFESLGMIDDDNEKFLFKIM
jgi:hypothetical protein